MENQILVENLHGTGADRENHIPDPRDYIWGRDVGGNSAPFDWNAGYDVETEISTALGKPFKITNKDQGVSFSCGGQAWSYYGQVLNAIHAKKIDERSAKFIYSQTFVGTGGSGSYANSNLCIREGWGLEADCASYEGGNTPSEAFMERKGDITPTAYFNAKLDKAMAYASAPLNVESIAQAVRDNYGCIFGITGINNGTWRTAYPQPTTTFSNSWNHWIYIGKLKMVNGIKYFGLLNSWGTSVGENGWQWLSESHVLAMVNGDPVVWAIVTMVMKDEVTPPVIKYTFTKTLQLWDRGPDVKMLQAKLGGLTVDGVFFLKTLAKVKEFQSAHGLVSDGVVGPKTNAVLNSL